MYIISELEFLKSVSQFSSFSIVCFQFFSVQNCGVDLSSSVKAHWLSVTDKLAGAGAEICDVSLPHFHYGVSCYTVLCAAEVSSNFAKYSSLLFGEQVTVTMKRLLHIRNFTHE